MIQNKPRSRDRERLKVRPEMRQALQVGWPSITSDTYAKEQESKRN